MADFLGTPFADLLNMIQMNHPDIFYLLSKPGVLKVALDMEKAEQDGHPWTQAQTEAAMGATEYWRNTTAQQRAWDVLRITDPATAGTKATATKQLIDDLQLQLGIKLDTTSKTGNFMDSPAFQFLNNAVKMGWTSDQIKYNLMASVNKSVTGGGDVGAIANDIKKTMNDYGVPMSDQAVMGWAQKQAGGAVDQQAILGYAQQQAMSLYPGLKDAISRGVTVRQYADPYLQIANQELGTDPTTVSLTDPKWSRAINSVDPKTGARVSMSLSDWTSAIRSDPTYGYDNTDKARAQAASFASRLGQMMGAQ